MKKLLIFISIGLLLTAIIYKIAVNNINNDAVIDNSEGYHRILIDSIKIDSTESLYWFKYNTGVWGYVGDYVSICNNHKQLDSATAILESDYIIKIDTIKNDSIFIVLNTLEYNWINKKSKYKFVFVKPTSYWDVQSNRKQLLINIDSVCK